VGDSVFVMFKIMAGLDGTAGGILAVAGILNLVINPSVKPFMSFSKLLVLHLCVPVASAPAIFIY